MKKTLYILLILLISVTATHAQLANWGNRGLTSFPTNISGQINGFCRITKLKFHNSNANKMYATTAEGGLFISSDAASNWTVSPGTRYLPDQRLPFALTAPTTRFFILEPATRIIITTGKEFINRRMVVLHSQQQR